MLVEKYNKTLVLVTWHSLCNQQGLCKGLVSIRPSVCLSVPSIDLSSGVRRVCCWAPSGQEIPIDGGGVGRPRQRRRSSRCGQCHVYSRHSRLNTVCQRLKLE